MSHRHSCKCHKKHKHCKVHLPFKSKAVSKRSLSCRGLDNVARYSYDLNILTSTVNAGGWHFQ